MSETTNLKLFKHDNPSTNSNLFDVTKSLNENWDKIDEYVTNQEATREENEKTRVANETERKLAETERTEAETTRNANEEVRKKAEEKRVIEEEKRETAETTRSTAEETRDTAEKERISSETNRKTAEEERETNEITREENEKARKENEELRKTAEETRDTAETTRETNEESRKEAELEREKYIIELKARVDNGDFKGDSNVLVIGTVTKGDTAQATLDGESPRQVLNLVLPKGDKGDKGEPGEVTIEQLNKAIAEAISSIQGIDYQIITELPETGEKGIIYLLSKGREKPNIYDEYLWVNDSFEMIGTTEIDLSGYAKTEDVLNKINALKTELEESIGDLQAKIIETNSNLDKLGIPTVVDVTLLSTNWILNGETNEWEYDIKDNFITENHKVDLCADNLNQMKFFGTTSTKSYNGGVKIITSNKQPIEDIIGELSIIKFERRNK